MNLRLVPKAREGELEAFLIGQRIDGLMGEVHERCVRDVDLMCLAQISLGKLFALGISEMDLGFAGIGIVVDPAECVVVADCYAESSSHK